MGVSGRVDRQEAYASDLGRLLGLGGERGGDEAASQSAEERATVYRWVLSQAVCESGVWGCGARGNRAGSMQEPSLQAGRESSRGRRDASLYAARASEPDRRRFLAVLGAVLARYHVLCHAYCLMATP